MTVASLKIGTRKFVVVPQREFDRMQREHTHYRRLVQEDQALGKVAEKELAVFKKSGKKGIPWARVKQELGL